MLAKGYDTISEAIAVADDGDFLLLLPGLYNEGVFLTKSISILFSSPLSILLSPSLSLLPLILPTFEMKKILLDGIQIEKVS